MFAVIKTGGKQYIVAPGQKLKIEKLEAEEGKPVIFDQVLLIGNDDKVTIGTDIIPGASVHAQVLRQFRTKKITVFKYRAKTRHHKKAGHRQHMTEVEIEKIISP